MTEHDPDRFAAVRAELERGAASGVFPGGVLLIAHQGREVGLFAAGRTSSLADAALVSPESVYDLASVTKILSTTLLAMVFFESGRLDLDAPLADIWPGDVPEDKKELTPRLLLCHSSGLAAWRPFYETLEKLPPENRRAAAAEAILNDPPECRPGERGIYSDLNFILLGFILENLGGRRQDELFDEHVARPLGLTRTGYRAEDRPGAVPLVDVVPTEIAPRRGGLIHGLVHDDNAASLGGVAGHAGLFGPVREVWKIIKSLADLLWDRPGEKIVSSETFELFRQRAGLAPNWPYALGFDQLEEEGSSAGRYFSRDSIGHLGFTGTSLWYDPQRDAAVILLTNRVHPTAENQALKAFRPGLHDLVAEALGFGPKG